MRLIQVIKLTAQHPTRALKCVSEHLPVNQWNYKDDLEAEGSASRFTIWSEFIRASYFSFVFNKSLRFDARFFVAFFSHLLISRSWVGGNWCSSMKMLHTKPESLNPLWRFMQGLQNIISDFPPRCVTILRLRDFFMLSDNSQSALSADKR